MPLDLGSRVSGRLSQVLPSPVSQGRCALAPSHPTVGTAGPGTQCQPKAQHWLSSALCGLQPLAPAHFQGQGGAVSEELQGHLCDLLPAGASMCLGYLSLTKAWIYAPWFLGPTFSLLRLIWPDCMGAALCLLCAPSPCFVCLSLPFLWSVPQCLFCTPFHPLSEKPVLKKDLVNSFTLKKNYIYSAVVCFLVQYLVSLLIYTL